MLTYKEIREMSDNALDHSLNVNRKLLQETQSRLRELQSDIRNLEAAQRSRASKKALEDSSSLKLLKEQYEAAQRVFCELSEYGATDSEPRYEFHAALKSAFEGETRIPKTGEEWQLYSSSMKCGSAARRLTAATKRVTTLIENLPQKLRKHAAEMLDVDLERW